MHTKVFQLAVLFFILSGVPIGWDCGSSAGSTASGALPKSDTEDQDANTAFAAGADVSTDGGTASPGNPLCGLSSITCIPDDDGTKPRSLDAFGVGCASPATPPTSVDAGVKGCRIAKVVLDGGTLEAPTYAPNCSSANGRGLDGTLCGTGADCAPGFDCVVGEKGSVCRRYCCSGSCESNASQNGGPTFCDIQKLVDVSLYEPVCMPLKTCKLLTQGECSVKETCAIVTDKGDTGCIATGTKSVTESCDAEHCAADLTCLGNLGDRHCYQLCHTAGLDCPQGQSCTTGSAFPDATYGVCKSQ